MNYIKEHKEKIFIITVAVFIMALFSYITYLTPLAGDDWGYAILGRENNPFVHAFKFYFVWSGRFFSELWGFVVAPNKWLWNILNPMMFTIIFLGIINLFKSNKILIAVVTTALILSVQNTLRIETYTWIMGSTYVVPLMMIIIYFNIIKPVILENKPFKNHWFILSVFLNFYITLCMENAAAVLVLLNILLFIYCYLKQKALIKKVGLILIVSVIGILLLRFSPGSNYRLNRDNIEWINMSLFDKISSNWFNFLELTFIKNNYLLFTLALILLLFSLLKVKNIKLKIFSVCYYAFNLIISMSSLFYNKVNISFFKIFFDIYYTKSAAFILTFNYLIYIGLIFILLKHLKEEEFLEGSIYLVLAGSGNLVMLISPIFGSRSSLYTVYFIIILIGFIISKLNIHKTIYILFMVLFSSLIIIKTREYLFKYRLVNYYMHKRNMEIEYYLANPDVKEIWLIRMPKEYIHSADIENWDIYHMEVFKEYYGFNQDRILIFYEE